MRRGDLFLYGKVSDAGLQVSAVSERSTGVLDDQSDETVELDNLMRIGFLGLAPYQDIIE